MHILLTGGTGFIGQELTDILLKEGHFVVVITRSPKKYQVDGVKNLTYISWEDDLTEAMNNCDAVINLVGENIFGQRWDEKVKTRIYDSRIHTTRKLVEAISKAEDKPRVLVSASASGIYGDHDDEILDESAPHGDDFLAHVCEDWEAASLKAEKYGVRVANPRIGIVLETGGGALEKMIPPFQFFVGGPVGHGRQYMSWIHRTDLCRALLYPVFHNDFEGPYNVCSPNPETMNDFARILGKIMNRPAIFRVPEFVLRLVYAEAAKPILDSIRMQPRKLQTAGFEFHFEELDEALADIID